MITEIMEDIYYKVGPRADRYKWSSNPYKCIFVSPQLLYPFIFRHENWSYINSTYSWIRGPPCMAGTRNH